MEAFRFLFIVVFGRARYPLFHTEEAENKEDSERAMAVFLFYKYYIVFKFYRTLFVHQAHLVVGVACTRNCLRP